MSPASIDAYSKEKSPSVGKGRGVGLPFRIKTLKNGTLLLTSSKTILSGQKKGCEKGGQLVSSKRKMVQNRLWQKKSWQT